MAVCAHTFCSLEKTFLITDIDRAQSPHTPWTKEKWPHFSVLYKRLRGKWFLWLSVRKVLVQPPEKVIDEQANIIWNLISAIKTAQI